MKLNQNLLTAGQSQITNCPAPVAIPTLAITSATVTQTAGILDVIEFSINTATVPAGFTLMVFATPSLPPSINFVKNRYRLLGTATAAASVVNVFGSYENRFGLVGVDGQQIHFRAALVSNTTGQMGVPVSVVAVVEEA